MERPRCQAGGGAAGARAAGPEPAAARPYCTCACKLSFLTSPARLVVVLLRPDLGFDGRMRHRRMELAEPLCSSRLLRATYCAAIPLLDHAMAPGSLICAAAEDTAALLAMSAGAAYRREGRSRQRAPFGKQRSTETPSWCLYQLAFPS